MRYSFNRTPRQGPMGFTCSRFVQTRFHCLVVALLFIIPPLSAQSEEKVNQQVVFQNEKLSEVLLMLSESAGLNFTYDANDPVYDTRITYTSEGESMQIILNNILARTGITHKQIGNQIVLYRIETKEEPAEVEKLPASTPEPLIVEIPVVKAEYRIDTLYITDTLYRVDTVWVTDTVFIKEEKQKKATQAKIKEIPVDFFQPGAVRDKGWALGLFAAPLLSDFSLVDGQETFTLRSFSLGMDAIKLLNRWNLTAGLRLTHFSQRFNRKYTEQEGGFFDTDTLDVYYTVSEMDTMWYYVTDSSWVPLEEREYSYEQTNTLGYLEFSLSASFDVYKSRKARIYLKAGGQASLLIYNNGIAIPNNGNPKGVDFEDLKFNTVNYSFFAGAGLKFKLAKKADFNTEIYYSRYFNSLVPDFPLNTQINALGLKVGLIFYY